MKKVLMEFLSNFIWRIINMIGKVLSKINSKWEFGVEQPPEFYDESFALNSHWRLHYTKSRYYSLWVIIADRIQKMKPELVLDVGCGSGQFTNLLQDKNIANVIGVDFSPARIEWARKTCPKYSFIVEDIYKSNIIEETNADCVVLLEFLEHVDKDIQVIEKIKEGVRVIATVPNFPATGHVRYFESVQKVKERYEPHFNQIKVDEHFADNNIKKYYLIDGIR
jgi:trans-aconitate methyltransferase